MSSDVIFSFIHKSGDSVVKDWYAHPIHANFQRIIGNYRLHLFSPTSRPVDSYLTTYAQVPVHALFYPPRLVPIHTSEGFDQNILGYTAALFLLIKVPR